MDDPLLPAWLHFYFAVHQKPLSGRQAVAEVDRSAIPEKTQDPAIVDERTDKELSPAAGIVSFLEPPQLAHEGLVAAYRGIPDFFNLPAVFVTKRQMVK